MTSRQHSRVVATRNFLASWRLQPRRSGMPRRWGEEVRTPKLSVVCAARGFLRLLRLPCLCSPTRPFEFECLVHHSVAISRTDLLAHGIGTRSGSVGVGSNLLTCSKPNMGSSDWLPNVVSMPPTVTCVSMSSTRFNAGS